MSETSVVPEGGSSELDVLVVASKLKKYIKEKSGLSTSATALPRLSDMIRALCDDAIEHAKKDGRKTVMDRDFQNV